MTVIDVYDVASSTWYKQATHGTSPPIRVDPCAVVATAPDGSSFNIYLYGGQNLIPYGEQIQYSDIWILTIPSFTWIKVDLDGQSQPPARAGHTCTLWDGQMVVVGGYVPANITCDSPGIYVFNASSLEWAESFTSLSGSPSSSSDFSNEQNYMISQGSYGYQVPAAVQSVIGGSSLGGATATTPAVGSATVGPLATGKPPTFTVTQSGSIIIETSSPTSVPISNGSSNKSTSGSNKGTIVAGVVAAVLAVLAGYLAFCTWLYRRQISLYKNHVAMAQRTAFATGTGASGAGDGAGAGAGAAAWMHKTSDNSGSNSISQINSNDGGRPGQTMLGPFGTEISTANSNANSNPGRLSGGGSSQHHSSTSGQHTPDTTSSGAGGVPMPAAAARAGYGTYGRLSGEDGGIGQSVSAGSASVHSDGSLEDLLGGQEPSFFSVVLNPRRTLRVVNSD